MFASALSLTAVAVSREAGADFCALSMQLFVVEGLRPPIEAVNCAAN
jgi:hypothetical protein